MSLLDPRLLDVLERDRDTDKRIVVQTDSH